MSDVAYHERGEPAGEAFTALLDALRSIGELVRDADRGASSPHGRANGYVYATELLRMALDLYGDADGDAPRFVPFSTPTPYHAGELALQRIQGGANPDGMYDFAVLRSDRSYRIHGRRGTDCYLSFSFSGGRDGEWPDRTVATLNDQQMTFGADGSFEIVVSADRHDGNWPCMEPDICSVIVRQYFLEDPSRRRPATLAIEVLSDDDALTAAGATSEDTVTKRLGAAAAFIRSTSDHFPLPAGLVENAFTEPLGYTGEAGALGTTDNVYCMGRWRLGPGEQLVVEAAPPPCRYWSLQVWNHWGQSLTPTIDDASYPRLIVNRAHADVGPDGSVRLVLAHADPGEPNWLDTFGWTEGTLIFRFLYPEDRPLRPTTNVLRGASAET